MAGGGGGNVQMLMWWGSAYQISICYHFIAREPGVRGGGGGRGPGNKNLPGYLRIHCESFYFFM